MRTQATTQGIGTVGKARSVALLSLALGTALSAVVALAGVAHQADAASPEKIVFASERTTGKGVSNPTGDAEIFRMNPNGTGVRQLTFNQALDTRPLLSPDGRKILFRSQGAQPSNPEGDQELYVVNASDGSNQKNLTDNGAAFDDRDAQFSPDGTKIAYTSFGEQPSNPEGDQEVYVVDASDGSGQMNLSNNGVEVADQDPHFSPNGQHIAYESRGAQPSNPEGDDEVYAMNALDGAAKKNLTNTGLAASDLVSTFSPDGQKIAYASVGEQPSNPEGEFEIYVMNSLDGTGKKNLTNSGWGLSEFTPEFSPDGQKIVFTSDGVQTSNPQGELELYVMSASDGSAKKNLTNNNARDFYAEWGR